MYRLVCIYVYIGACIYVYICVCMSVWRFNASAGEYTIYHPKEAVSVHPCTHIRIHPCNTFMLLGYAYNIMYT